MAEPITMHCPGSGSSAIHSLCPYCGKPKETVGLAYLGYTRGETIEDHDCDDIIAMLDRGDFDPERRT